MAPDASGQILTSNFRLPAVGEYIEMASMITSELTPYVLSFLPADTQVHYSGVPLLTPYQDYPPGCLPDTLVIRRATSQKALQKLLLQHPTAANITVMAGTVRGIETSADRTWVESVIIRKSDGTQVPLNDVALVAGIFFVLS